MLKFLVLALLITYTLAQSESSESTSSESTSNESTSTETSSGESSSGGESPTTTDSSSESSGETGSSSTTTTSTSTTTTTTTTTTTSSTTTTTAASTTLGTPVRNSVDCNYYYSSFDTSYFAYAIDQCTQKSIYEGTYMYATCVDEDTLTVKIYLTAGCTGDALSTNTYDHSTATFYCGGVNAYAQITISPVNCGGSYNVYSAINTCTNATSSVWSSVYCVDNSGDLSGQIQYYSSSSCVSSAYFKVAKFNETCGYLFQTVATKTNIYGKIVSCYDPEAATPATTGPANMYSANVAFLFLALIFAVLQL